MNYLKFQHYKLLINDAVQHKDISLCS